MEEPEQAKIISELDAPVWAIVGSGGVESYGMTYARAVEIVDALEFDGGRTIVTIDVAERLRNGGKDSENKTVQPEHQA